MNKVEFEKVISTNFDEVLSAYVNDRPDIEKELYSAEVTYRTEYGDEIITMTFYGFPFEGTWWWKSDPIGVIYGAMFHYANSNVDEVVEEDDFERMYKLFESAYDWDWQVELFGKRSNNHLKIWRRDSGIKHKKNEVNHKMLKKRFIKEMSAKIYHMYKD